MKVLYLPPIAYDNLKQRPQYLAEELSKKYDVIYVDPTVSILKYMLKGGEKPFGYRYFVSDHLEVIRMNGMLAPHRSLESIWKGVSFWEKYQIKKLLKNVDVVWVGYCPWFNLICDFKGTIIYDKMDDDVYITQNFMLKKLISEVESKLIYRADHILYRHKFLRIALIKWGKKLCSCRMQLK